MTRNEHQTDEHQTDQMQDELRGEVVDEGTTGELLQDKMTVEGTLRAEDEQDQKNVNDLPGFDDGRLGGSDYEDRQGDPNTLTGSDLGGEAEGGAGTERSGGVDGGPERETPLPG